MRALYVVGGEVPPVCHAEDTEHARPGGLEELQERMRAAGVATVIDEHARWCDCPACWRVSLMASLRLAQHEGRGRAIDACLDELLGGRP